MPHLIWSREAIADLTRLHDFLRSKSPAAADRAVQEIDSAARRLLDFPRVGRANENLPADVRQLPIAFSTGGYMLYYRPLDDRIEILWVRHQREDQRPSEIP